MEFTHPCLLGESCQAESFTEIAEHEVGDLAEFKAWQAPAASGDEGGFRYNGGLMPMQPRPIADIPVPDHQVCVCSKS